VVVEEVVVEAEEEVHDSEDSEAKETPSDLSSDKVSTF
jgi:hypothetical protein